MILKKHAIILAAGKGTRMNSEVPKCAVVCVNKPMAQHVVDAATSSGIDDVVVVVGSQRQIMCEAITGDVTFAVQDEQKGTGHAVKCCETVVRGKDGITIVLPGDVPFVDKETIEELISAHIANKNDLTITTIVLDDPKYYGRIVRENGNVVRIVEFKDANSEELLIREVNSGILCCNTELLFETLKVLKNDNKQNEYYLTDVVEVISKSGKVGAVIGTNELILVGINDQLTLQYAERKYHEKYGKN